MKPQCLYLNDQNNPYKSRVWHNKHTFLIITHINLPTANDATLFAWALQIDGKLTLINSEYFKTAGDMYSPVQK